MDNKEKIKEMYYKKHFKVKEIEKILSISSAYISRIIKADARYEKERLYRKELVKAKKKLKQNAFIKQKREQKRLEDNYLIVKKQHRDAVKELSKGSVLTNENYRKWNRSAYKYNPSKKRYEFDESLGHSYAVPKYIKER